MAVMRAKEYTQAPCAACGTIHTLGFYSTDVDLAWICTTCLAECLSRWGDMPKARRGLRVVGEETRRW